MRLRRPRLRSRRHELMSDLVREARAHVFAVLAQDYAAVVESDDNIARIVDALDGKPGRFEALALGAIR